MKTISKIASAAVVALTMNSAMAGDTPLTIPFNGTIESGCIVTVAPSAVNFGSIPVGQPGWVAVQFEVFCTDGLPYYVVPGNKSYSVLSSAGEDIKIDLFDEAKATLFDGEVTAYEATGNGAKQTVRMQLRASGNTGLGTFINGVEVIKKAGTFSGSFPIILSY